MKKSTKKYLLYGAGAYVLLTSGVLGASKVQSYKDEMEYDRQDYDARDESRIREIRLLEQSLAESGSYLQEANHRADQAEHLNKALNAENYALGVAFMNAEDFIAKNDPSLNLWNEYSYYSGNAARGNPLLDPWTVNRAGKA